VTSINDRPSPRRVPRAAATLGAVLLASAPLGVAPRGAEAQNLGPFRQLLAVEPYYTRFELDRGGANGRLARNGYGGRLWINLAPFTGDSWILPSTGGVALFVSYAPGNQGGDDLSVWHYGAQHDLFFRNRPFARVLDPFLSVAAGVFRTRTPAAAATHFALSPGGGIRIPVPNRFHLRADVRDAIRFGVRDGATSGKRTAHNLELQAALGITF
jgi:hypothetical protein